jgi:phosphoenolpyruvate carboxykinase (ATP)
VLENVRFHDGLPAVNYHDDSLTENTRAAYPLRYADQDAQPLAEANPSHIFFLTADASGVLPPLSKLTEQQAMAYFLAGYTSKLAGTEMGIVQPKATFSSCFGAAFLPLPARQYADLLAEKIRQSGAQVWLVNTGWTGGAYGTGHRMPLRATRALIRAVLTDALDAVRFESHPVFGLAVPQRCPDVDSALFSPTAGWADEAAYAESAQTLRSAFLQYLTPMIGEETARQWLHS